MEISKSTEKNVQVISLKGRLDSNTSKDLENTFNELLNDNVHNILCDLKELDYISSAGLRVFLKARKNIDKNNWKMALCSMNDFVYEIFEIAGFLPLFMIFEDREQAVEKFFN